MFTDTLIQYLSPEERLIKQKEAEGPSALFRWVMDSTAQYKRERAELLFLLAESDTEIQMLGCFALENFESGMEGFVGDLWFKFIQLVKRIIGQVRVMIQHFLDGINGSKRYLEAMRVTLRGGNLLNWDKMFGSTVDAYDTRTFQEALDASEIMEGVLRDLFKNPSFDLDGITKFQKWGITFSNGRVIRDHQEPSSATSFDLDFNSNSLVPLRKLGWNQSYTVTLLDQLISHLEFHNEKDYLFVDFKSAAETLIRKGEHDSQQDPEKIRKMSNSIRTASAIIVYLTSTITFMSNQMVSMMKLLEEPVKEARDASVY